MPLPSGLVPSCAPADVTPTAIRTATAGQVKRLNCRAKDLILADRLEEPNVFYPLLRKPVHGHLPKVYPSDVARAIMSRFHEPDNCVGCKRRPWNTRRTFTVNNFYTIPVDEQTATELRAGGGISRPVAVVGGPPSSNLWKDRYSRQRLFPGIGAAGQQRLANSHVTLVGCGATGAASASLLARAGVGTLTIIDRDFVEPSNLQRQVLFTEQDAREALPKAEAARRRLHDINHEVEVRANIADLTPANCLNLLAGTDVILDATDNFETRYLINDFSVQSGTPWIYAAAIGSYAATMNILPGGPERTACLACLFPEPPGGTVETCDTAGILNTAVDVAASLQTTEALKFLCGHTPRMRRTLLSMDLWSGEHSEVRAGAPRAGCTVCGVRQFRHLSGEGRPHITLCGRDSVQIHEHSRPVDFNALAERLRHLGKVRFNSMLLRFSYGEYTLSVFADGRTVVQGTTEVARARALYARFIGS